jgi:hypothetical protein
MNDSELLHTTGEVYTKGFNEHRITALSWVAGNQNCRAIETLLKRKRPFDMNKTDDEEKSPVACVAGNGFTKTSQKVGAIWR